MKLNDLYGVLGNNKIVLNDEGNMIEFKALDYKKQSWYLNNFYVSAVRTNYETYVVQGTLKVEVVIEIGVFFNPLAYLESEVK